ncbi:PemK-like, MazF-like toxin of type II toxin-antitoxin system [Nakamurella panacisegetis]|uniref:PemK-like, MazF-like toxin of type II toxin-antitoxin system n=1 Tax=Nakamurella panacisegetis TaxID=1090615 RepID=A0A1H0PLJ3_9ACTN|nr:type II toxin-antitoxin system PemK/MazF family toxin [Nakamurella panacisegetis]SDP05961.1 PemK-like, MazF-like toxin of type II toxin-antitoxin system [Nakamurella panacisegetis]
MSFFSNLINRIRRPRPTAAARPAPAPTGRPRPSAPRAAGPGTESPGRFGPDRTVEVDPHVIGSVRTSYSPVRDGDPDPGEIVWTWVPFEENDGQGKDRPVLVVAAENAGTVLVVQLTSKDHDGESGFVPVGSGDWDGQHRESWANLERVLRVHPQGMRREAAALDRVPFEKVVDRLRARYGWS